MIMIIKTSTRIKRTFFVWPTRWPIFWPVLALATTTLLSHSKIAKSAPMSKNLATRWPPDAGQDRQRREKEKEEEEEDVVVMWVVVVMKAARLVAGAVYICTKEGRRKEKEEKKSRSRLLGFLVAKKRLYKRSCPSVGPPVVNAFALRPFRHECYWPCISPCSWMPH